MKTRAAILRGVGQDFEIAELDLDPPKAGEVLIRYVAAGLCHSDEHLRHGDIVPRFPLVGGHEGAGIIEEVGEGVTRLKPGDHVICSFLPVCGHCRWCSTGKSNLCDLGATILDGCLPDGTYRFHAGGETSHVAPGTCIALPARAVHCLENTGQELMRVVAVFRPAGSPAAAYYPDGTPAFPGLEPVAQT